MTMTRNADGTVTLTMSKEDAKNLVYVADDMAEVYEDIASNSNPDDGNDPEFLKSVANTLTSMAGALFGVED